MPVIRDRTATQHFCVGCSSEVNTWRTTYRVILSDTWQLACRTCRDEYFTECTECREYIRNGWRCANCGTFPESRARFCSCGCGARIRVYDDDSNDSDDSDDSDDSEYVRGRINSYSYKPNPDFRGEGPTFFGLEAEVTVPYNATDKAVNACQDFGDVVYLKSDASVSGFEIVTHPMSYEYALESFPWKVFGALDKLGCSGESAGIHVHVSRDGFKGAAHTYRWMKFVYRNQRHVTKYARRSSGEWAPFKESDRKEIYKKAKGERGYERYAAINTTNSDTFELRIFAGSVNPEEVKAAIGFTAATIEYTRHLDCHTVIKGDGWSWKAFTRWLADKPQYACVIDHIERTNA
jgi:hypothetical protein